MAQQTINIGAAPNDGTGDTLRDAGDKANDNFTELYTGYMPKSGGTFTGDIVVPDEAYDATTWNASLEAPTKNAIRDKIEDILDGVTFTGDIIVPAEAYGVGWNGSNEAPTKNDVYDKIESVVSATVSDAAYGSGWNGDTTAAPSKNAVYDKIEDILDGVTFTGDIVVPDEAYDATAWNGSLEAPTKNAVRDKIEAIIAGGSYTDEQAQDAVGGMVDASLTYVDATPLLQRAALTGDVTAPAGSNSTTVANANYSATLTATGTPPTNAIGYLGAPQNLGLDSGNVTLALTDCGKSVDHTDSNARDLTIPANGSVAFPVGTIICGSNEGSGIITMKITTDTLRWGSSTGQRSIAQHGSWTIRKVASTIWRLTGDGIT